jgi:hypothetical protein
MLVIHGAAKCLDDWHGWWIAVVLYVASGDVTSEIARGG